GTGHSAVPRADRGRGPPGAQAVAGRPRPCAAGSTPDATAGQRVNARVCSRRPNKGVWNSQTTVPDTFVRPSGTDSQTYRLLGAGRTISRTRIYQHHGRRDKSNL